MFGRMDSGPKSGSFESLVGKGMEITGTVKSKGSLRIEGSVEGDIACLGDVAVGDGAVVNADVTANNVTVGGTVKGNILCSGRLELLPAARVVGDVTSSMLVVAEGAVLAGKACVADPAKRKPPVTEATGESPED